MPPFSRPVASTRSRIDAPTYPRWLKTGAASSTIRCRVAAPLVVSVGDTGCSERLLTRCDPGHKRNRTVGFVILRELPVGVNTDGGHTMVHVPPCGRSRGSAAGAQRRGAIDIVRSMCGRYVSVS